MQSQITIKVMLILVKMEGVYFINTPELGDLSLFKIGWSQDINNRLGQLQTGNGFKLNLYNYISTSNRKLEKEIHTSLNEYRKQGEWFNITESDVDEIIAQYEGELEIDETQTLDSTESTDNEIVLQYEDKLEIDDTYVLDKRNDNIIEEETKPILDLIEETTIIKKIYKNQSLYACHKCNKSFKKERHLQRHLLRKISCDKKFICDKCKKQFRDTTALSAHLNRVTSCAVNEVPIIDKTKDKNICRYCNKTYATPYSLKRHQKSCDKESNIKQIMDLLAEQDKKWEQRFVQITGMNLVQPNHIEIDNSTKNLT